MNDLILKGYEFLTVILPIVIAYVIVNIKSPKIKGYFIKIFIFSVYIFAVFYFTGAGTIFDLQRYGIELHNEHINLLPFSNEIEMVSYALNILLFVPFGVLLPFIWPNTDKLKSIALSAFSFSLLIEASQLFNNRATDVDDLMLNTFGALVGYLLFKLFMHMVKWTYRPVKNIKWEPAIYIIVMFLGHFLLFDMLGMAKILYGF